MTRVRYLLLLGQPESPEVSRRREILDRCEVAVLLIWALAWAAAMIFMAIGAFFDPPLGLERRVKSTESQTVSED